MKIVTAIPLLLVIIVIYNIMAFGILAFGHKSAPEGVDCAAPTSVLVKEWCEKSVAEKAMDTQVFGIKMVSKETWTVTISDLILVFALIFLFIEIIRATNIRTAAVTNNALSMFVFILALIEFLIVPGFSTSTFFLIVVMTLIDTIAGFIIGMISARRDIGLDPTGLHGVG